MSSGLIRGVCCHILPTNINLDTKHHCPRTLRIAVAMRELPVIEELFLLFYELYLCFCVFIQIQFEREPFLI